MVILRPGALKTKDQKKLSIIIEVIFILIEIVVPQVQKFVKINHILFLKSVQVNICKLHFSKINFKKYEYNPDGMDKTREVCSYHGILLGCKNE